MRFLDILLTFFAIITPYVVQAANTISVPTAGDNVMAGDDLKIKWTPSTKGKITLTLRFGAANSLSQGTEIACKQTTSISSTHNPQPDKKNAI